MKIGYCRRTSSDADSGHGCLFNLTDMARVLRVVSDGHKWVKRHGWRSEKLLLSQSMKQFNVFDRVETEFSNVHAHWSMIER